MKKTASKSTQAALVTVCRWTVNRILKSGLHDSRSKAGVMINSKLCNLVSTDRLWRSAALWSLAFVQSAQFVWRDEFFSGKNSGRRSFCSQQQEPNDRMQSWSFRPLCPIPLNFVVYFRCFLSVYLSCLSLSLLNQLSAGVSCHCLFLRPSVAPSAKCKSVKPPAVPIRENPPKLEEKVASGNFVFWIPQLIRINCLSRADKMHGRGENQDCVC